MLVSIVSNAHCHQRILALTGPAGSGKTAVIRALSQELDWDILEWQNSYEGSKPPVTMDPDGMRSSTGFVTHKYDLIRSHQRRREQVCGSAGDPNREVSQLLHSRFLLCKCIHREFHVAISGSLSL
jgi:ABC-type phosphate/phosphonate transport system ATPase subunit